MRRGVVAFTLIELMVATAILLMLLGVVFMVISETGKIWRRTSDQMASFQDARAAFESMTSKLGQATLNPYYEYFDSAGRPASDPAYSGTPSRYGRQSDLHFLVSKTGVADQVTHAVFFQAPLGEGGKTFDSLHSLLNACGYFVRFTDDASTSSLSGRPPFLDAALPLRYRFCLMEVSQPAEDLSIFQTADSTWLTQPLSETPPKARVIAENIIALVILPKLPDPEEAVIPEDLRIGASYEYDTRTSWSGTTQPQQMNQLCPILKIVMIAIDETSARRLQGTGANPPDLGFSAASVFQNAAALSDDLALVSAALTDKHIGYRIFETEIALPNAKWTTQ